MTILGPDSEMLSVRFSKLKVNSPVLSAGEGVIFSGRVSPELIIRARDEIARGIVSNNASPQPLPKKNTLEEANHRIPSSSMVKICVACKKVVRSL